MIKGIFNNNLYFVDKVDEVVRLIKLGRKEDECFIYDMKKDISYKDVRLDSLNDVYELKIFYHFNNCDYEILNIDDVYNLAYFHVKDLSLFDEVEDLVVKKAKYMRYTKARLGVNYRKKTLPDYYLVAVTLDKKFVVEFKDYINNTVKSIDFIGNDIKEYYMNEIEFVKKIHL